MPEEKTPKQEEKDSKFAAFVKKQGKKKVIIVGAVSAAAVLALVLGLSIGLTANKSGGDSTVPPTSRSHTHTYGADLEVIKEASETEDGQKGYTCTVCGEADPTRITYFNPYVTASDWTSTLFAPDVTNFSYTYNWTWREASTKETYTRYGDIVKVELDSIDEEGEKYTSLSYFSKEGDAYYIYQVSGNNVKKSGIDKGSYEAKITLDLDEPSLEQSACTPFSKNLSEYSKPDVTDGPSYRISDETSDGDDFDCLLTFDMRKITSKKVSCQTSVSTYTAEYYVSYEVTPISLPSANS